MELLAILLWCIIGGVAAGAAHELNDQRTVPFIAIMMVIFAPLTVLYVIGFLAMMAGRSVIIKFRNQ